MTTNNALSSEVERVATYAADDADLFCRHCGTTHVRHLYERGVGIVCPAPTFSQDQPS